jgi:hypothetical protein
MLTRDDRCARVLCSAAVGLQARLGRAGWSVASLRTRATAGCWIAVITIGAATGCIKAPETALERLSDARRLAADLLVDFTRAGDAANRAVMADTDEASVANAREAEQATQAVLTHAKALGPILAGLGYSDETRLLEEFGSRFAEYRAMDRSILGLAVENTNLKAQRLSFGLAQDAADAFRSSLEAVAPLPQAKDTWQVEALVATAASKVLEVQVLQAPHIAESDEAAMTRIEQRMATSEAVARRALEKLAGLARESRPQIIAATAALDRFIGLNTQIVAFSRRNSNVRSSALSLGRKRTLTAGCEDSLRALRDALAKRGFVATR